MPTYDYRCTECETHFTAFLRMSNHADPQACPECGHMNVKVPSLPQFICKGDGWSTKNERIKNQMRKKNEKLNSRQDEMKRDTKVGGRLVPNVDGEKVDSWAEASKLAQSQGKSADTYAPLVAKEASEKGK